MSVDLACIVEAKGISVCAPAWDTFIIEDQTYMWWLIIYRQRSTTENKDKYISNRCNWRDSGRGWSGTHPSLTHIRPTLVSTWISIQSFRIRNILEKTLGGWGTKKHTGKAIWCGVSRRTHSTLLSPSPLMLRRW